MTTSVKEPTAARHAAKSVDEELARLDKGRVKAVVTKISREPVGIERTLENPNFLTVLESPELSRALAIGQLRTVNDVPLQVLGACGIHQEEAAFGAKRVVDAAPEPVGMALRNVRKPERKEDDVIVLIWLPAEEIVNPELDIALTGILQLRQSELAHLRRCIHSDHTGRPPPRDGSSTHPCRRQARERLHEAQTHRVLNTPD